MGIVVLKGKLIVAGEGFPDEHERPDFSTVVDLIEKLLI